MSSTLEARSCWGQNLKTFANQTRKPHNPNRYEENAHYFHQLIPANPGA